MDNTDNPRPELREWDKWNREHENILAQNLDYWGFVSWKFKEKMNLTGRQVLDWININPGYDVYLLNPCIVNEAIFRNSWDQGELYHKGIAEIATTYFNKIGMEDFNNLLTQDNIYDRNSTVYANYFVASREFWVDFMQFSRNIHKEAELDPDFKQKVFGEGLSNYAHDKSLPMFTFLIERLIPTFIIARKYKSLGFLHDQTTLPEKYQPVINEIMILSDLKVMFNLYQDMRLQGMYQYFRTKLLEKHPNILNLE
jgi:hypothetical protein